jgi:carboxymethylenebutenolidase
MERKKASDFPQELLDLLHVYVHGDIGRREFLHRAQKFAVGGVTAAALFEMLKPNYALANQVPEDDKRITSQTVSIPSPQGNGKIDGYLVRPAGSGKVPGILVVHENRGLNPYIKDVARRVAIAGYMALAPDGLTSVGGDPPGAPSDPREDEKGVALFKTVDPAKMREDFFAAAAWLQARPDGTGKLGATGFCFGGGIVNQMAVRLPDLAAAVPFYGAQPPTDQVPNIKAPLLIHYAGLDTRVNEGWPAYEAALKENKITYTAYIYPNVNHGFHNDTTPRYDKAAAELAWQRTIEFFNKELK